MNTLYFDCFSGISGDMSVGALIDIGAEFDRISFEINRLFPDQSMVNISTSRRIKCGVSAMKFDVTPPFPETKLHTFADIRSFIEISKLSKEVKSLSIRIFENLAIAESTIHGIAIDDVHFHEVGAFDSIVDIISFSIAFLSLDIQHIFTSPVALGYGSVQCQHGNYPVPAMATLELLKTVPVYGGDHPVELTTPTGAAIVKTVTTQFIKKLPKMHLEKVGYGAGDRDLEKQPNVLRVVAGRLLDQLRH